MKSCNCCDWSQGYCWHCGRGIGADCPVPIDFEKLAQIRDYFTRLGEEATKAAEAAEERDNHADR